MADVNGTDGADRLVAGGGDDVLRGYRGEDTLEGGDGNDTLYGCGGGDVLTGGAGADTLRGGEGHDAYRVDSASDRVEEAGGTDLVLAAAEVDPDARPETLTPASFARLVRALGAAADRARAAAPGGEHAEDDGPEDGASDRDALPPDGEPA